MKEISTLQISSWMRNVISMTQFYSLPKAFSDNNIKVLLQLFEI